ncbi:hypothetical protein A3K72_03350 [Candidatus Woesearchaeota archaeon RBG_13_36_6]|nr:MAG: hypothetical protein A3K72_03350 [Candidatus Woesearchaeota archaeon RBG_13_36_6]
MEAIDELVKSIKVRNDAKARELADQIASELEFAMARDDCCVFDPTIANNPIGVRVHKYMEKTGLIDPQGFLTEKGIGIYDILDEDGYFNGDRNF